MEETAEVVYLEWIDSAGFPEWQTQDEVDALIPYLVRTAGILVNETDMCLVVAVAETIDQGESCFKKCYNGIMSIPKVSIFRRLNISMVDENE
jgi:hypothetical protein